MSTWKEQVALVTGTSSGIGRATALAFASGAVASLALWVEELRKLIARCRERRPTLEVVHNE